MMTSSELTLLLAEWKNALGVKWKVSARFVSPACLGTCSGRIHYHVSPRRTARILISAAQQNDHETALVHELLHLVMLPFRAIETQTTEYEEAVIERLAQTLVSTKRNHSHRRRRHHLLAAIDALAVPYSGSARPARAR